MKYEDFKIGEIYDSGWEGTYRVTNLETDESNLNWISMHWLSGRLQRRDDRMTMRCAYALDAKLMGPEIYQIFEDGVRLSTHIQFNTAESAEQFIKDNYSKTGSEYTVYKAVSKVKREPITTYEMKVTKL